MGQEIKTTRFDQQDFAEFAQRLRLETDLLRLWFTQRRFSEECCIGGFELEACLVDAEGLPAPINARFLEALRNPLVVPELAAFNVELNTEPRKLVGPVLSRMHDDLQSIWDEGNATAARLGAELVMIGILPTLPQSALCLANMSAMKRYTALNEQIFRLRRGNPVQLQIAGSDKLRKEHHDVMLESAATSFQIHLQVSQEKGPRLYNASKVVAAPMVAACANSPYLFGCDLWDETRIPLFEQAVCVGGSDYRRRVTFGVGYAQSSLMECFDSNRDRYPLLLPMISDDPREKLSHLRLHNGTIWRWNRPLIGFDADGTPHLRVEHRVIPAGPSVPDSIANLALYFGLAYAFAHRNPPAESRIPFEVARDNFYAAARQGLRAEIVWLDGNPVSVRELLLTELLPLARQGLSRLDLDLTDMNTFLAIIEARVRTGQNGTNWQRAYVAKHGPDMQALCSAYRERQASATPVHEWTV